MLIFKKIIFTSVVLLVCNSLSAATFTVGPDAESYDYTSIQDAIDSEAVQDGDIIEVAAGGDYGPTVVNKQLTIIGVGLDDPDPANQSRVGIDAGETGFEITADNVHIEGMVVSGPYDVTDNHFTQVNWGAEEGQTFGLNAIGDGADIVNNLFVGVRSGINATGSDLAITGNTFSNTKGSILLQNAVPGISISGNSRGAGGNEWDIVVLSSITPNAVVDIPLLPDSQDDPLAYGQAMRSLSVDNNYMTILDRRFEFGNISHAFVSAGSVPGSEDDFDIGNGLGNPRQPLGSIQHAVTAVASYGVISVTPGEYNEKIDYNGTSLGLLIDKPLTMRGIFGGQLVTDPDDVKAIIFSGAESNWGTNFYVTGSNVNIIGLGFAAISADTDSESLPATINKAFEVTADGFNLQNSIVTSGDDYNYDGDTSTALYFGDDGADDLDSFTINNNRIEGGVTITNGAGDGDSVAFNITNNVFTGNHFLRVRGAVDDVGWLNASAHLPTTISGNDISAVSNYIMQVWGDDAESQVDADAISSLVNGNTLGTSVYTLTGEGALSFFAYSEYGGTAPAFFLRKSIQDTIDTALVGETVYITAGNYEENLSISQGLTLAGAAIGDVTLAPASGSAISIKGNTNAGADGVPGIDGVTIRDLTIDAADNAFGIISLSNNVPVNQYDVANLAIRNVVINNAALSAIGLFDVDGAIIDNVTINGHTDESTGALELVGVRGLAINDSSAPGSELGLNVKDASFDAGATGYAPGRSITLTDSSLGTRQAIGNSIAIPEGLTGTVRIYGADATLQQAIDEADSGDTIIVNGTHTGDIDITTTGVTLTGDSAVLEGSIDVSASGVTITGLEITGPTSSYGIQVNAVSNVTINSNHIHDIGTEVTSSAAGIYVLDGTTDFSGISITDNVIEAIGQETGTVSNKGIYLGDSTAEHVLSDVEITGNTISNVTTSRGGYGILVNFGVSAAGYVDDMTISDNTISDVSGSWVHAIGLETDTANTAVTGNVISALDAAGDDEVGVFFESNDSSVSVTVTGNSFTGMAYGVALHPVNQNKPVKAAHNYWGDAGGPEAGVQVSDKVSYRPWYTDSGLTDVSIGDMAIYTVCASDCESTTIQGAVDLADPGDTVMVEAGTYAEQVVVDKEWLTIKGVGLGDSDPDNRSRLGIAAGETGFDITAENVSIEGMVIFGPYVGEGNHFTQVDWNAEPGQTFGIDVSGAESSITGNLIIGVRTGINVTASDLAISNNYFANTKGSILLQTAVPGIEITGNARGIGGNEWDIVVLSSLAPNDDVVSIPLLADSQDDALAYGQAMMALSEANNNMTILDRRFEFGNISHASVVAGSSPGPEDDFGLGNGLGNPRQPLGSIQHAVTAVASNGYINVAAGEYAEEVVINKSGVTIYGAGLEDDDIDTRTRLVVEAGDTGFDINGDNVTVEGMVITGPYLGAENHFTLVDWSAEPGQTFGFDISGSGVEIADNLVVGVRTGINASGSDMNITSNIFSNTKGSILLQTAVPGIEIASNVRGLGGNEWDVVVLSSLAPNDDVVSIPLLADSQDDLLAYGQTLMGLSATNNGMTILDRRFEFSNVSHAIVQAGSNPGPEDDFGLGNGLGNPRQPLGSIQHATTAVAPTGFVLVRAGSYTENVTISKALSISGPGINVADKAVVSGSFSISSPDVRLSGLEITGPTAGFGVQVNAVSNVTINGNHIHDIGTEITSSASGIYVLDGTADFDDISITDNIIEVIGQDTGTVSNKGIYLGDSTAEHVLSNVEITGNSISNIATTRGGYGILANFGVNAAGSIDGMTISDNTISDVSGSWVHAIGLETDTANTTVTGNIISSLDAAGDDETGVFFEGNESSASVVVTGNSFSGMAYGVALHPVNQPTLVTATHNWWGVAGGPASSAAAKSGQGVTFNPWYTNASLSTLSNAVTTPDPTPDPDPDPDPTPDPDPVEEDVTSEDVQNLVGDIVIVDDDEDVSEEVIQQVSQAAEAAGNLAQNLANSINEADDNDVIDALNLIGDVAGVSGNAARKSSTGGNATGASSSGNSGSKALNSFSNLLTALDGKTNNATAPVELSPVQKEAVQQATVKAVSSAVNVLSALPTSGTERKTVLADLGKIVSSSVNLGIGLSDDQANELLNAADTAAGDDDSSDIDEQLSQSIPVKPKNKALISRDSLNAALGGNVPEEELNVFLEELASAINPADVKIGNVTGDQSVGEGFSNAVGGAGSGSVSFDPVSGNVVFSIGALAAEGLANPLRKASALTTSREISARIISANIVSSKFPDGLRVKSDGSVVITNNRIASVVVPASADPLTFYADMRSLGYVTSVSDDGNVTMRNGEMFFSGTFDFRGVSTGGDTNSVTVFDPPAGDNPIASDYFFTVRYRDGRSQRIQPFVMENNFLASLGARGINATVDRNSGVIRVANMRFRPSYYVISASEESADKLGSKQDEFGLAFRVLDANDDGNLDIEVISSAGVQIVYGMP